MGKENTSTWDNYVGFMSEQTPFAVIYQYDTAFRRDQADQAVIGDLICRAVGSCSPPPTSPELVPSCGRVPATSTDLSSLKVPFSVPEVAFLGNSPATLKVGQSANAENSFCSRTAMESSHPVRSSRDPRLKYSVLRASNRGSEADDARVEESYSIPKVGSKMSVVDYFLQKESLSGKAVQKVGASLREVSKGEQNIKVDNSAEKILPEMSGNCRNNCKESSIASLVGCSKEMVDEDDYAARMNRMFEEVGRLGKEIDEEKKKIRRLGRENEKLDIEIKMIDERLK